MLCTSNAVLARIGLFGKALGCVDLVHVDIREGQRVVRLAVAANRGLTVRKSPDAVVVVVHISAGDLIGDPATGAVDAVDVLAGRRQQGARRMDQPAHAATSCSRDPGVVVKTTDVPWVSSCSTRDRARGAIGTDPEKAHLHTAAPSVGGEVRVVGQLKSPALQH
jgi:hypothetical protein